MPFNDQYRVELRNRPREFYQRSQKRRLTRDSRADSFCNSQRSAREGKTGFITDEEQFTKIHEALSAGSTNADNADMSENQRWRMQQSLNNISYNNKVELNLSSMVLSSDGYVSRTSTPSINGRVSSL